MADQTGPTNPLDYRGVKNELRLTPDGMMVWDGSQWSKAVLPSEQLGSPFTMNDPISGGAVLDRSLLCTGDISANGVVSGNGAAFRFRGGNNQAMPAPSSSLYLPTQADVRSASFPFGPTAAVVQSQAPACWFAHFAVKISGGAAAGVTSYETTISIEHIDPAGAVIQRVPSTVWHTGVKRLSVAGLFMVAGRDRLQARITVGTAGVTLFLDDTDLECSFYGLRLVGAGLLHVQSLAGRTDYATS